MRRVEMKGRSESNVQARVRLEAADKGVKLFRNNVGAGTLANGNHVRWGLANDSPAINAVIKSGDLIGGRPRIITLDMVGTTLLQFVSRECKAEGWKPDNSPRTVAQIRWRDLINSLGGDAAIVDDVGSL